MGKRAVVSVALVACALGSGGCGERIDPALQPDAFLRDSLGLGDGDRVHTVHVGNAQARESADPGTVEIRPGDLVQFIVDDGRPHTVAFVLDSLGPEAVAFLRAREQDASPPLVERDARFVVTFREAPAGRYPFVVEGTGEPARGVVVVSAPEPG